MAPVETSVGATLRFFGCWVGVDSGALLSSFSDSLAVRVSRFPSTLLVVLVLNPAWVGVGRGVCGGVVSGSADGCAECVAVTNGTQPRVGVGLLTTAPVCWVDCVAIEEVELERAGLAGGAWALGPEALLLAGAWVVLTGDWGTCVGVGRGVA